MEHSNTNSKLHFSAVSRHVLLRNTTACHYLKYLSLKPAACYIKYWTIQVVCHLFLTFELSLPQTKNFCFLKTETLTKDNQSIIPVCHTWIETSINCEYV